MGGEPGNGNRFVRIFLLGFGGILSVPVALLAIVWGWHVESALRQDSGVDVPASLQGYNVFITGSTSGIGFEAAIEFYRRGAHVFVHSSDYKRAVKSAEDVRQFTGQRPGLGSTTPVAANLAHFDQLRALAKNITKGVRRLDVLILNACRMYGLAPLYNDTTLLKQPASVFKSPSGHDTVLAVNHLGHYLLTELLLPILAHGARIVIMSAIGGWSGSHTRIMPPWGYLGKHKFGPQTSNAKRIFWEQPGLKPHAYSAYHDSKYMNFCYGYWLRRRLERNATVIIHDPGYVMTTPMMSRDSPAYKQRRNRQYRQTKLWMWHAPSEEAGRHLLEATFVTRHPVPELVSAFFMPRQVVSWMAPYAWEGRRAAWVSEISNYQKILWGLHASVGPQCDEELQDRLMQWSAQQVAR